MADIKQNSDGSVSIVREIDGLEVFRAGGGKTPGTGAPVYLPGASLVLAATGGTDTGGGLTSWQNTFPFDIIITNCVVDVTAASSGACTAEWGTGATSTTANAGLVAATSVAATGQLGGNVKVRLAQNNWLTGSTATGASSGLVARVYVEYVPVSP